MLFFKKSKKLTFIVGLMMIVIVTAIVVTIAINNEKNVRNEEKVVKSNIHEDTQQDINEEEKKINIISEDNKINEISIDKSDTGRSTISINNDEVSEKENSENQIQVDSINKEIPLIETPTTETPPIEKRKDNLDEITLQGYLIDEDCFVCYPDPSKESLGCLIMPECAASGYGIAFLEGGEYKFYFLDGNISTYINGERTKNATGGQQLAWDFINMYIAENNIPVKVTGQITKETHTNPDKATADNKFYPVFRVETIVN